MSIPKAQIVLLKFHFPVEEIKLLGEMTYSISGAGNAQGEPKTYCYAEVLGGYQTPLE